MIQSWEFLYELFLPLKYGRVPEMALSSHFLNKSKNEVISQNFSWFFANLVSILINWSKNPKCYEILISNSSFPPP